MKKITLLLLIVGTCLLSCEKKPVDTPPEIIPNLPKPVESEIVVKSILPMSDGPGATITISGKGFGNGTAAVIEINGIKATIKSYSDSLVRVIVPDNATTGKIRISADSHTYTSADDFVILSGSWLQKADYPGEGQYYAIGFSINGKGYMGLGTVAGTGTTDLYEFDPSKNTWAQKQSFPGGRRHGASVMAIDGKAYVVGGSDENYHKTREVWEYDPLLDKWERKKDFQGKDLALSSTFVIGKKGYVVLGHFISREENRTLWEYDPANDSWIKKADFPAIEYDPFNGFAFSLNNKGYVGMSETKDQTKEILWQYDPVLNEWTRKKDFNADVVAGPTVWTINNRAYMLSDFYYGQVLEYNPDTDSWHSKTSHYRPRSSFVTFTIGNSAYVGMGHYHLVRDFWQFNPTDPIN